jgi:serine/threonine-protein kinase
MAPEQMKSGRSADPRSDIWSLGVVTYQLIAGRPPFSGESYAELVLKVGLEAPAPIPVPVPTGLDSVIMRCLEKDPDQRHQSVGEFARMLAPFATDPIAAAQSASRTLRTLQQRSSLQGMGSPLTAGGGLATPIPISPAQLTPRSWPPSQGTSVSRGAGQVTYQSRGNRGWLIAGVAFLCVAAGGGGYAISQLSRGGDGGPREPHVMAPAPRPEPAAAALPSGTPTTAPADPPAPAQPPAPPAAAPTGEKPAAAAGKPAAPVDGKPAATPADDKPAAAADGKPASAPGDDRPADRLIDAKHPLGPTPDTRPAAKPTSRSTASGSHSQSPLDVPRSGNARPTKPDARPGKPDARPTKPGDAKPAKPADDPLFKSRT